MKNLNNNIYVESEVMLSCDLLIDEIDGCIEELKGFSSYETISLIDDMITTANECELCKLCNSLNFMVMCDIWEINIINTLVQADEINKLAFLDIEHHINDYLTDYKFYDMNLDGFAMFHLLNNSDIPGYVKELISFERYKRMLIRDGLIASNYGVLYPH